VESDKERDPGGKETLPRSTRYKKKSLVKFGAHNFVGSMTVCPGSYYGFTVSGADVKDIWD